jgi:hypothetical protein
MNNDKVRCGYEWDDINDEEFYEKEFYKEVIFEEDINKEVEFYVSMGWMK